MLDPSVIRRLAFIKYLYKIGVQQSKAPEPFANAALLTFHDAAELFLQLSAEHMNADVKAKQEFTGYWPLISARMEDGNALSQQEAMRRLNTARVSLKHSGTQPSKADLESFRVTTDNFFEDNTKVIFGLSLAEVSLVDLVTPEVARQKLKRAEELQSEAKLDDAACEVAVAFEEMINDYEVRKRDRFHQSPFSFGPDIGRAPHFSGIHGVDRYFDRVHESIQAMQKALKVMAFGIDFRRYSRFQSFVPYFFKTANGNYHFNDVTVGPRTAEMIQFCIEFVVESAVQLREFDYDANE